MTTPELLAALREHARILSIKGRTKSNLHNVRGRNYRLQGGLMLEAAQCIEHLSSVILHGADRERHSTLASAHDESAGVRAPRSVLRDSVSAEA